MTYIPPKAPQVRLDSFLTPPTGASDGEMRQAADGTIWICTNPTAPTWHVVLSTISVTA